MIHVPLRENQDLFFLYNNNNIVIDVKQWPMCKRIHNGQVQTVGHQLKHQGSKGRNQ